MAKWRTVKLGEVLKHRKQYTVIDDALEYKRCRVQLHRRGVVLRDVIKGHAIKTKKQQLCHAGDFIVAEMDAKVGGYGFINKELEGAIVSSHYYLFELNEDVLLRDFLRAMTKTDIIQSQIQAKGSTNYASIRPKEVLNFEIPLPPIDKQVDVIQTFEKYERTNDDLSQEIGKQQTFLQQFRQAILQEAVQGKLTESWRQAHPDVEPASELLKRIQTEKAQLIKEKKIKKQKPLPPIKDEEIPFELPRGWTWCRLGECGLFERGKSKHRPRNDSRLFENGIYPFVQTGDVAQSKKTGFLINTCTSYYNDVGLAQSRMWSTGTLCITIAANIAETGFLTFDACFPDSVVGFTPLKNKSLSKYVNNYLCLSKTEIEKYAPATAQKNINLGIINQLLFPLPPEEEQKIIVTKVDRFLTYCDQLEQQNMQSQTTAEQLMQAVLREAFTTS